MHSLQEFIAVLGSTTLVAICIIVGYRVFGTLFEKENPASHSTSIENKTHSNQIDQYWLDGVASCGMHGFINVKFEYICKTAEAVENIDDHFAFMPYVVKTSICPSVKKWVTKSQSGNRLWTEDSFKDWMQLILGPVEHPACELASVIFIAENDDAT